MLARLASYTFFGVAFFSCRFALPGDMVVVEGMLATAMYFLIQGKCDVIGGFGTKSEEIFSTLSDGDHFGEIGVLMQVRVRKLCGASIASCVALLLQVVWRFYCK
jgi:CRP-like cAMP-binding protein